MKKIVCFLGAFAVCAGLVFAASFKNGAKVYVSVKSAVLKDGTGLFAKSVGKVSYGDNLIVVESGSKKTKVRLSSNSSLAGWIPNGSLTTKKISKSGGSSVNASSNELALAGKGFSAEAEKAFKSSNGNLDYAKVDEIEKITVSENELSEFITEGHLRGGE
ncbi:MAG: hypothetical protein II821_07140 [Treponema sp.]|nr:hypothetical protein [Treponema sp.]